MQTQTNKSTKKAAKRRNRNKRRRKLRQQRKLEAIDGKIVAPRKKNIQKLEPQQVSERWEALCLETFQRLITWQSEAELNFWKARTEYLQKENKLLKQQVESLKREMEEEHDDENDDVDPGYLEFIAITRKHREELRRARANISENLVIVE